MLLSEEEQAWVAKTGTQTTIEAYAEYLAELVARKPTTAEVEAAKEAGSGDYSWQLLRMFMKDELQLSKIFVLVRNHRRKDSSIELPEGSKLADANMVIDSIFDILETKGW